MIKRIIIRTLFFIIAFCVIFYSIFILLLPFILKNYSDTAAKKFVLIIGDFKREENFGKQVLNGFEYAIEKSNKGFIEYKVVQVDEELVENVSANLASETETIIRKAKENLINEISSKNVIAIVSANTSQTVKACLEVGTTFNIPVLITVATDDKLTQLYPDIAFQLLANNGVQADAIINWMSSYSKTDSTFFGILYTPTIYGNNLLNVIREKIGFDKIIPFTVNTTTDLVGTINYGKSIGVSAWVSLSYLNESMEIQLKKERIDKQTPILYSDGAYGNWINFLYNRKEKNVYMSFPETHLDTTKKINKFPGFTVFGYDSFIIIDDIIQSQNSTDKISFIHRLNNYKHTINNSTILKYKFQKGENQNAKFKIYKIDEDIP